MQIFDVKPKVHLLGTFAEFAEEFGLGANDLLLTETILFDRFVKPLNPACHVILKDTYDPGEPNEQTVDSILNDIRGWKISRVIAMGGGSVIDIGKVITVRNAYPIRDVIYGRTDACPDKDLIVIPTTCGTGSEVTYGGIITMQDTGLKTAIMDERLTARHAVLIPELIAGLPFRTFVHCSMDALGHSMESYVSSTRGNEIARAVGARSISLLLDGYSNMVLNGPDYRQNVLQNFIIASCLGGMAVNNGGAGPVHALAYPLGEKYKMSHGESIAQFLCPVFRMYQSESSGGVLEELIDLAERPLRKCGLFTSREEVFTQLEVMFNKLLPMRRLSEAGMTPEDVEPFADSIMSTKQRLLVASYVPFTRDMAVRIYRERL
ncbi:MAG: 4-hydroxybutyrate dehydrogenase [Clostridiaceae bacterium]|nr:4-hydroxybutyrate dehydrogenase [Clostridiaceae bacterium]